jgi:DNA-binding CsgD family transcriptional regulator
MLRSEAQLFSLADSFHSAAVGATSWESALRGLARATGSRSIQLTGIGPKDAILFDIRTHVDAVPTHPIADNALFKAHARVANRSRTPKAPANSELAALERAPFDPYYQEVALPCEVPWLCMSTSDRRKKMLLALAGVRSHHDGQITREQRETFSAAALHVRSALRTHIVLQQERVKQLAMILEALSIAVFVCDGAGKVRTLTHTAEALLTAGRGLQLVDGEIRASRPEDARALSDAIGAATPGDASAGCPLLRTIVVRGERLPVVVDVFALPSQHYLELPQFAPSVLVVARGAAGGDRRRASLLQAIYGLTGAETEIALRLAEGKTAEVIASNRGVAVGTVRAQIKTVLAKVGVRRQVELAGRLTQL